MAFDPSGWRCSMHHLREFTNPTRRFYMSERFIRFSLHELQTVRLCCLKCRMTVEMSVDDLVSATVQPVCPGCKRSFRESPDVLSKVGDAIRLLRDAKEKFR